MKKNVSIAAAVAVLSASSVFALTTPGGGVLGSVHDMNMLTGIGLDRDAQGRVCAFCHTPHHAISSTEAPKADYLPLWSHKVTEVTTFGQYDSGTFDAKRPEAITDPLIGPSRLCMSCHDGQIAPDQHYGSASVHLFPGNEFLDASGAPQIGIGAGTNALKRTHPIGFDLAKAVTADTAETGSNFGGAAFVAGIASYAPYKGTSKKISSQLYDGKYMTCATCHDVHNKDNVPNDEFDSNHPAPTTQVNYLVFAKQAGSQLCLSCHDK